MLGHTIQQDQLALRSGSSKQIHPSHLAVGAGRLLLLSDDALSFAATGAAAFGRPRCNSNLAYLGVT